MGIPVRSINRIRDNDSCQSSCQCNKAGALTVPSVYLLADNETPIRSRRLAVVDAAADGQIKLAIDVFPDEPLAGNHRLRALPNVILSPHRAAAVAGGRQLIGRMIVNDLQNKLNDDPGRELQIAQLKHVAELASVGDAHKVAVIAGDRDASAPAE